jgi:hypothetical protein
MFRYLKMSIFYMVNYHERGKQSRKIVRTQETGAGSEVEKEQKGMKYKGLQGSLSKPPGITTWPVKCFSVYLTGLGLSEWNERARGERSEVGGQGGLAIDY